LWELVKLKLSVLTQVWRGEQGIKNDAEAIVQKIRDYPLEQGAATIKARVGVHFY
jgi:hypothetical protein